MVKEPCIKSCQQRQTPNTADTTANSELYLSDSSSHRSDISVYRSNSLGENLTTKLVRIVYTEGTTRS